MLIGSFYLIKPIVDLFIDLGEIGKPKAKVASCCVENDVPNIGTLVPKVLFSGNSLNFMRFYDLMLNIPSSSFFDDKIGMDKKPVILKPEVNQ